jgi:hypothetical protein
MSSRIKKRPNGSGFFYGMALFDSFIALMKNRAIVRRGYVLYTMYQGNGT